MRMTRYERDPQRHEDIKVRFAFSFVQGHAQHGLRRTYKNHTGLTHRYNAETKEPRGGCARLRPHAAKKSSHGGTSASIVRLER